MDEKLKALREAFIAGERSPHVPFDIEEVIARCRASAMRRAIVEGYEDVLAGRTHEFTGDLEAMLREYRHRKGSDET